MTAESVSCNKCGAPLGVSPGTNFVTCSHCGSRLAVKRTGSSLYTELLEKLDRTTEGMSRQLAEIAYRAELERLDREWEGERRQYLSTDKHGNTHEPTAAVGGNGLADGPFLLVYCFPLFGIVFVGFGLYALIRGPAQARRYEAAKQQYHRRKASTTVEQFLPRDDRPEG